MGHGDVARPRGFYVEGLRRYHCTGITSAAPATTTHQEQCRDDADIDTFYHFNSPLLLLLTGAIGRDFYRR